MKRACKVWLVALMFAAIAFPRPVLAQEAAAFKKEEIEQLVAPIALYPDALVAQILMASTYPLEVVEAARWSKSNSSLKGKALEDAMQQQKWDPSVKSLTAFPQVIQAMSEKLDVTQKLGDAFLGQQKEVLDAVQRLRGKADQAGNLKSTKEQTVSKEQEGGQTVIKIEPSNPEVVYVPTYNPAQVYGPWPYPAYPPYAYYPWVPGAALFTFGVGLAVGSALWGGCNWGGGGGVYINHNNYNNFNRTNISNKQNWQHNAEHRRGQEYRDKGSQDRFGKGDRQSAASREQFRGRAEQGRQDIQRGGDQFQRDVSAADRARGGDRGGGGVGDRGGGGFGDRGGAGGGGLGDRGGGGGGFDRASHGGGAGAFDRGGGGGAARDHSSRGASSRASAGASRGGGGGGGGRGGGGGGRGGRR